MASFGGRGKALVWGDQIKGHNFARHFPDIRMVPDFIQEHIYSLLNWLEESDYSSYDHYDSLATRFGVLSKRLFSEKKLFGLPLVGLIFFLDTYFPHSRKSFAKKARSAEALPRIAESYFRLYRITGDSSCLERGCNLLDWLKENGTYSKHGVGWGLHFDWEGIEFLPKGTPCVTLTAYSTKAFLEGYRLTEEKGYLEIALKTSEFEANDLNRKDAINETAVSYTPLDHNYVINANSYAAKILVGACQYHDVFSTKRLLQRLLNYILAQQNPNGSWYYFDKNDMPEGRNFIDSFHTCFVLENLYAIWKWQKDERLRDAIDRGYMFFKRHFINSDFSVSYFYRYPYPTGIEVDIRCCAEAIHCLAVLSEIYPEALNLARKIAEWTIKNMQDKDGYFYFRIYRTHKNRMPYTRWGQAPMLNALTALLMKENHTTKNTKGTKNGF